MLNGGFSAMEDSDMSDSSDMDSDSSYGVDDPPGLGFDEEGGPPSHCSPGSSTSSSLRSPQMSEEEAARRCTRMLRLVEQRIQSRLKVARGQRLMPNASAVGSMLD